MKCLNLQAVGPFQKLSSENAGFRHSILQMQLCQLGHETITARALGRVLEHFATVLLADPLMIEFKVIT